MDAILLLIFISYLYYKEVKTCNESNKFSEISQDK